MAPLVMLLEWWWPISDDGEWWWPISDGDNPSVVRDQKRQPLTRLILANAFIHKECIPPYRYTAWRS